MSIELESGIEESYKEAYEFILQVKDGLQKNNRFFVDECFLHKLNAIFEEAETSIEKGTILYRARKYNREEIDESRLGTQFEGYNAEESFVNLGSKWPTSGRMNAQGITVLYVANDIRTAITELHPYFEEYYSVASIEVKNSLKIADLSKGWSTNDDDFTRFLAVYVQEWVSQGSSEKDYVFPQYISSYCKFLGYDGIGYRSKYATRENVRNNLGINYTIFNHSKCKAIESKLYQVRRVAVSISPYRSYME